MEVFPTAVRKAMVGQGTEVTCLPVQLDAGQWEGAVFFHLAGEESRADREALAGRSGPVAVGMEAETLELAGAAVVALRVEVHARSGDPLAGEILLTPGAARAHFDLLQGLSQQSRLCWFFGDPAHRVIHSQQHALEAAHREELAAVLQEAVEHDALVRLTGRYDADAALAEVAGHYGPRGEGRAETRP